MEFRCGEAICKASVVALGDSGWPKCPECKRTLYPRDALDRLPFDGLEEHRALLRVVDGGRLRDATEAELATARGAPSDLEAMLDASPAPRSEVAARPRAARSRKSAAALVWIGALLVVAVVVAILLVRAL